jgi:ApaG protein
MMSATTNHIQITVDVSYQPQYSVPFSAEYLFAYHIRITNHSDAPIQVLNRQWVIHDGPVIKREVRGSGLVGKQPHIAPGHTHEYVSYCNLTHMFGKMQGKYEAIGKLDGSRFWVEVPAFTMMVPQMLM